LIGLRISWNKKRISTEHNQQNITDSRLFDDGLSYFYRIFFPILEEMQISFTAAYNCDFELKGTQMCKSMFHEGITSNEFSTRQLIDFSDEMITQFVEIDDNRFKLLLPGFFPKCAPFIPDYNTVIYSFSYKPDLGQLLYLHNSCRFIKDNKECQNLIKTKANYYFINHDAVFWEIHSRFEEKILIVMDYLNKCNLYTVESITLNESITFTNLEYDNSKRINEVPKTSFNS
jgi:hypothetical protein